MFFRRQAPATQRSHLAVLAIEVAGMVEATHAARTRLIELFCGASSIPCSECRVVVVSPCVPAVVTVAFVHFRLVLPFPALLALHGHDAVDIASLFRRHRGRYRRRPVALLSKTATDVYICRCLRPTVFQLVTSTISLLASNTKDFGSPDLWLVSNPTKAVQQAK